MPLPLRTSLSTTVDQPAFLFLFPDCVFAASLLWRYKGRFFPPLFDPCFFFFRRRWARSPPRQGMRASLPLFIVNDASFGPHFDLSPRGKRPFRNETLSIPRTRLPLQATGGSHEHELHCEQGYFLPSKNSGRRGIYPYRRSVRLSFPLKATLDFVQYPLSKTR